MTRRRFAVPGVLLAWLSATAAFWPKPILSGTMPPPLPALSALPPTLSPAHPLSPSELFAARHFQKAERNKAALMESANNLKTILIALHNHHDVRGQFPQPASADQNGKPLLSWRVAILPFIEQEALYEQFKLNEPWDSEHNKKLIERMPKTFALPGAEEEAKKGLTHYRVFFGPGAAWEAGKGFQFTDFTDGTSNTWMVVVAKEAVPWTKPEELPFDPKKNMGALLGQVGGVFQAAFADGSVRNYPKLPNAKTIQALITRNGGEVIDD